MSSVVRLTLLVGGLSSIWPLAALSASDLSLIVDPMLSPVSARLTLLSDQAAFFEYDRNALIAHTVRRAKLDAAGRALLDRGTTSSLRPALQVSFWGKPGLTEGDQFSLAIGSQGTQPQSTRGFLSDAPPALRELVGALLSYGRGLKLAPLAPAYLLAEKLAPSANQTPSRMEDLPATIRGVAQRAVENAGDFTALTSEQVQLLKTGAALDYLQSGSNLYHISLFQAR